MSIIKLSMNLPFYLRLETPINMSYDEICIDSHISELSGNKVEITFAKYPANSIDRSDFSHVRTTITVILKTRRNIKNSVVSIFVIQNCLEIINRVITAYQATTGGISNAGFITPLGTSDIQLFADISVNNRDFRDRWPGHNQNTFRLDTTEVGEFKNYLINQRKIPLSKLFFTNAGLSLERGQYPLAVFQGAAAVELRITQVTVSKLKAAGFSNKVIKLYRKGTLGSKLKIPDTDPRSLETYFKGVNDFANIYKKTINTLNRLRNKVIHQGYLASQKEAKEAVSIANDFLNVVI